MGWNVEIACIAVTKGTKLDGAVPDVFCATERKLGWEGATSATSEPELSAAKIGTWYVVVDVGCRLTASPDYPIEASAHGDAYLFRVADDPIALHYRNGKPQHIHRTKAAVLRLAGRKDKDGELAAWDLMTKHTGLTLAKLFDAKFTVFELD